MNKADIVDKVHGVLGSTKADAERAVETVIDSIVSSLKSGDEVSIAGLGIFATKARPATRRQQPATTNVNGLSADIDFLRNQIEHLRTEVLALSGAEERPRPPRRSRGASAEAELPQPLRRQNLQGLRCTL